jgi:hypothetical protein
LYFKGYAVTRKEDTSYGMDVAAAYKGVLPSKGFEEISGDVSQQVPQLPALFPSLHVVLDI